MDGSFSDVTSSLDYDLDDSAPDGAIARIDYMYGDRIVGQAYLEASTVPGYQLKDLHLETSTASANAETEETFPVTEPQKEIEKTDSSLFDIAKKILVVGAVIGAIGAVIFGIILYREKQEERAMIIRRESRERRRKEWGSSTEFNLVMQEHLRSKNQFKKRSFWDKIRNWFRR